MNLTIDSQTGGLCHLSLAGKISQTAVDHSADELCKVLGEAHYDQQIIVSLRQTDYIDSSGIGWLLATDKKIRAAGGRLILHSLPLDIQHVFGLLKLNTVLKIAKDKQHAIEIATEETHEG
ncbi:MAG: STAS domain-containing protein [Planctomycetales bacterium]|nr:STAS domain-containing protein [Planctomycetales bacterium]